MGSAASYLFFFLLLVGPLVLIHEFGHFAVAKLLGIKVVRFSFGFGPRLFGFRRGDTDYRVSLLPLGGYVKMAGDNPAETLAPEDRGRGFLEAPPWKRALIAVAGPLMNLILPIGVFFAIAAAGNHEGVAPMVGSVMPDSPAARAGLHPGDRITGVDGHPVQVFEDLRDLIGDNRGVPVQLEVQRAGERLTLTMTPQSIEETDDLETTHRAVIGVRAIALPATIGLLDPKSPAALAGLATFDRVVKVGEIPIKNQIDLQAALTRAQAAQAPVQITAVRGRPLGYAGLGPGVPQMVKVTLPPAPKTLPPFGIDAADLFVRWVIPGSPAAAAGLRIGDRLLAVDGKPIENWWGFEDVLKQRLEAPVRLQFQSPGGLPRELTLAQTLLDLGESPVTGVDVKALGLGVLHDGEPLTPNDQASPRDWVFPQLDLVPYHLSLGACAQKAWGATVDVTRKEIIGILRMFQGRVSVKKLGGPLMIADVARQAAANGLAAFLFMMTLVSINLGLVNLLPLPVLDGGHIVTSLVEVIQRRPLSRRAYEVTNAFGMVLLLALMVFVFINDIVQKHLPGLSP